MKMDPSWATAVVSICALVTALVNRCDSQKTNTGLRKQFTPEYWDSVRDGTPYNNNVNQGSK